MKNKKIERDFVDYFIVGLIIQLLSNLSKISEIIDGSNNLEVAITLILVDSIVMAGFCFYFNEFNKNNLALKTSKILIFISLISIVFIQLSINSFLLTSIMLGLSILAFFLGGIIIYGLVLLAFWIFNKIKPKN